VITEFIVTAGEIPKRLDQFLVHRERNISRANLQRLIEKGRIRVNARLSKSGKKIKPGDRITMDSPQPEPLLINNQVVPLDILYEDEALLVLNKPAGIVVHPATGNWSGTLLNALLAHFQAEQENWRFPSGKTKPGLVHRLDKDTSGMMVVAKTPRTHQLLAVQFETHSILRQYEALVWSIPRCEHGVIELPIGRDDRERKKVSFTSIRSQPAVTEYRILQHFGSYASRVKLSPRTGRTHQLRVHLASIGCPILGDEVYGDPQLWRQKNINIPRVMLHAKTLGFRHPFSGKFQEYTVNWPLDVHMFFQSLHAQ
jgi:23S rRNA pseudouridine1911/1915/1917 synthase